MNRSAGLAFGAALVLASGLAVSACGQSDTPDAAVQAAPEASQTTQATRPVVTVYKSPT